MRHFLIARVLFNCVDFLPFAIYDVLDSSLHLYVSC